jgi:hypothetical protein
VKRIRCSLVIVAVLMASVFATVAHGSGHLWVKAQWPEVAREDSLPVEGERTEGASIEIYVNGTLQAVGNPAGNRFRSMVYLRPGRNQIKTWAVLPGERVNVLHDVFRTAVEFSDTMNHWARTEIEMLATEEVVSGLGDGTFGPERLVSRAEFAKMLVLGLNLPVDPSDRPTYIDVAAIPEWARPYVAAATRFGLMNGFEDGSFRPEDTVTRVQEAVSVARGLRMRGFKPTEPPVEFIDQAEIPAWANEDVQLSARAGIVTGYSDGRFHPARQATRAESAVIIKRLRWKV